MSLTVYIPVYSERFHRSDKGNTYRLQPAFPSMPWKERENYIIYNPREDRALEELTRILRNQFNELAQAMRHDALLRWSFCPEMSGVKVPIRLFLRKQSVSGDIFVVIYTSMGRRIVTMPKLPGIAFDVERGELLEDRANEVLTKYFRKLEKRSDGKLDMEQYLSPGSARLTSLEINIRTSQKYKKPEPLRIAALGGGEKLSGAQELEKVGRCLNRLYPQRLARAILRDDKVEALSAHFAKGSQSPPPLVLIGPSQVGKSAVIQEFLFRMISTEEKTIPEVWLISPQRIISGMSYVGQWEERAHAIFQEARRRKHILLLEDLPGLFQAGRTRDSELTVGQVLKAYLEEGGMRIMAEASPESWRKIREMDRGFADYFRSLPIEETSKKDTLRILIRTVQEIESRERGTYFEPDLIPAVFELQNRFARTQAFPGKAVEVIRHISQKYTKRSLNRDDVFDFFQARTGIQRQFLQQEQRLERGEIFSFFDARIKGQPAAVNAMTDLVINTISQLNEPGRPMGSLLFLGPTGVGKTECAKALAQYFFGTSERLIRFDMNEFVGFDAVERLIGSMYRPRGLLTGAVRRQPYSVILLDEIEKSQTRVFDLLLQLLGDGRLTDAAGETTDFCNCIVVMTSNLGARNARHQLGFARSVGQNLNVFREAAEKFFRPELFNRIDHIVPFGELSRADIELLVALMSEKALSRIGLSETQLSLKIQPDVYARLAEHGFKPEFGARALRRSVEEFLIEPIALSLSRLPKNQPAIVTCSCGGGGRIDFTTSHLKAVPRGGFIVKPFRLSRCDEFVGQINEFLYRIEDDLESWRDESDGVIDPSDPQQIRYFALREDIMRIRRMRDHFQISVEQEILYRKNHPEKPPLHQISGNHRYQADYDLEKILMEIYRATEAHRFFNQTVESAEPFDHIRQIAGDIINRINAMDLIVNSARREESRCLIDVFGPDRREMTTRWQHALKNWLDSSDRHTVKEFRHGDDTTFLIAEGPGVYDFVRPLGGTHLLIRRSGKAALANLRVTPLPLDLEMENCFEWVKSLPFPVNFEVNLIQSEGTSSVLDVASGMMYLNSENQIWNLINPHLSVVEEMVEFVVSLA